MANFLETSRDSSVIIDIQGFDNAPFVRSVSAVALSARNTGEGNVIAPFPSQLFTTYFVNDRPQVYGPLRFITGLQWDIIPPPFVNKTDIFAEVQHEDGSWHTYPWGSAGLVPSCSSIRFQLTAQQYDSQNLPYQLSAFQLQVTMGTVGNSSNLPPYVVNHTNYHGWQTTGLYRIGNVCFEGSKDIFIDQFPNWKPTLQINFERSDINKIFHRTVGNSQNPLALGTQVNTLSASVGFGDLSSIWEQNDNLIVTNQYFESSAQRTTTNIEVIDVFDDEGDFISKATVITWDNPLKVDVPFVNTGGNYTNLSFYVLEDYNNTNGYPTWINLIPNLPDGEYYAYSTSLTSWGDQTTLLSAIGQQIIFYGTQYSPMSAGVSSYVDQVEYIPSLNQTIIKLGNIDDGGMNDDYPLLSAVNTLTVDIENVSKLVNIFPFSYKVNPDSEIQISNIKYILNNGQIFEQANGDSVYILNTTGFFSNTALPMVCAFSVEVSANHPSWFSPHIITESMSAVFIDFFPVAEFDLYPLSALDSNGNYLFLDSGNYGWLSPGTDFYAEGHASHWVAESNDWVSPVGTNYWSYNFNRSPYNQEIPFTSALWPLSTRQITNTNISFAINTQLNDDFYVGINLRRIHPAYYIFPNSYGYYFDDETGEQLEYPFFKSTNRLRLQNPLAVTNIFDEIHAKPYDVPSLGISLYDPNGPTDSIRMILGDQVSLTAVAEIVTALNVPITYTDPQLATYVWYLSSPRWENTISGIGLSSIEIPLSAVNDESNIRDLDYLIDVRQDFYPILVQLTFAPPYSAIISANPKGDWQYKNFNLRSSTELEIVTAPPFLLYTPVKYIVTGEDIFLENCTEDFGQSLSAVEILADGNYWFLQNEDITNYNLQFTPSEGLQSLNVYVTAHYVNGTVLEQLFENIIYRVNSLEDSIENISFIRDYNNYTIQLDKIPLISNEEWVTENNINWVIETFYNQIDQLLNRSLLYQPPPSEYYGWFGTLAKNNIELKWTWRSIECPLTDITWDNARDDGKYASLATWRRNACGLLGSATNEQVVGCFDLYDIPWSWRYLLSSTPYPVQWQDTVNNAPFQKRWMRERVEDPIISEKPVEYIEQSQWHVDIDYIDNYYNQIRCGYNSSTPAFYYGIQSRNRLLYLITNTQIRVLSSDRTPTLISSRSYISPGDNFFALRGLEVNKQGQIIVLDQQKRQVVIFEIDILNELPQWNRKISWGGFGGLDNPYRFLDPTSLHLDFNDQIYIVDQQAKAIKVYTSIGGWSKTLDLTTFEGNPYHVVKDQQSLLHISYPSLREIKVFNDEGEFQFSYSVPERIRNIWLSYDRNFVYVASSNQVYKYFRDGRFAGKIITQSCVENILSGHQDSDRNLFVLDGDKIIKYIDRFELLTLQSQSTTLWDLPSLRIHKEEYIQDWVYNRSFQRIWDNIERVRQSILSKPVWNSSSSKIDTQSASILVKESPKWKKSEILIGQNEVRSNEVVNRCIRRLWDNLLQTKEILDVALKSE